MEEELLYLSHKSLRKKMREWGIIKSEYLLEELSVPALILPLSWLLVDFPSQITLEEKVKKLELTCKKFETEIDELKKHLRMKTKPSKIDIIYEKYKSELEDKYFGKIVAIDIDEEIIVSIGDDIKDAYNKAIKKSDKKKFAYKRIGYDAIYRLM